jgi:hypothetical protein
MATLSETTEQKQPGIDDHFGLCPKCVEAGDFSTRHCWANVARNHYVYCKTHGVYWYVGSNLLSSWREEDESIWNANESLLEGLTRVEPRYLPQTEADIRHRSCREWQVRTLFLELDEETQRMVLDLLCKLANCEVDGYRLRPKNYVGDSLPF